ncbi:MAG: TatD family hydrolase, partial [Acidimicrobiales bacterium]
MAAPLQWVDSHCHIPYQGVGTEVIAEARAAGVTRMITVGTDAAQSRAAMETARAHDGVWATVGLHPHDAKDGVDVIAPLLTDPDPAVVAVGECGLDYFYEHSSRRAQRAAFAAQIAMATAHDLALVIHTRDAWDDTFDLLAAEGVPARTVFHCFTGGLTEAGRALDTG